MVVQQFNWLNQMTAAGGLLMGAACVNQIKFSVCRLKFKR
jgi:hypothetical protein